MTVDGLTLTADDLPPVRMQIAARELMGRYRNRPAVPDAAMPSPAHAHAPALDRGIKPVLIPAHGILFDCDGVLVDSDASVISAWSRWASTYGFNSASVVDMVHGAARQTPWRC